MLFLFSASAFSTEVVITAKDITDTQVYKIQHSETYTYIRCLYRPYTDHDDPATDWEWALNEDGSYYTISGYWWSSLSLKNMFYSNEAQQKIKKRCEETLNVDYDTADITYFAADHGVSYNDSIWTNDEVANVRKINRIVAFGDSLSDTGNVYNDSQWTFPNRNA